MTTLEWYNGETNKTLDTMMTRMTYCLPLMLLAATILSCTPTDDDPEPGSLGGPCHPNGTCDRGLVCRSNICQEEEPCTPQATLPCTCADLSTGARQCDAFGVWGACVCSECGNGIIEGDEQCDSLALGGLTCATASSHPYGVLGCTAACQLDTSGCHGCGNGTIDSGEVCDGNNVSTETCASQSSELFGDLACNDDCSGYDTSDCHSCGDGVVQTNEVCDGNNVSTETCASQSSETLGDLVCNATCSGFDTSDCHSCGDEVIQPPESCDGSTLGGETCTGLGYASGDLACAADCTFDESACVPAVAQTLELCALDADCDTNLYCRALVKGGTKRCTPACATSAGCPSGTLCLDDGTGATYCLGGDVGRGCTLASQCNFACLTSNTYCTVPCVDGHDCPNGYGCMPVGTPSQNVCVRAEAHCATGNTADCIAPAACDESPTLILGGCTTVCTTAADCPQRAAPQIAWTCDAGGICRRPGDVYGPLPGGYTPTEYHCDAAQQPVNLCNDAQHMDFTLFTIPQTPTVDCQSDYTTVGVTGDACVNSCRDQGGCAYGYACVALGGIGGERVGLCLPAGSVETGAGCTQHTQCVSGYCYANVCSRDCTFDGICPGNLTCTAGGGPNVEGQIFKRCE